MMIRRGALGFFLILAGCAHPSAANNKLRDDNQKLKEQIAGLDRQHAGDEATIRTLELKEGTPPELSAAKLGQLFTVHGIKIGRFTGSDHWDPTKRGPTGLQVAVEPIDQEGDQLKAAGTFVIDAFDLGNGPDAAIGHWTFDLAAARKCWLSGPLVSGYVLKCEWQKIPVHNQLTLRIVFTDALTGRQFTEQKVVKVELPFASTQPASRP